MKASTMMNNSNQIDTNLANSSPSNVAGESSLLMKATAPFAALVSLVGTQLSTNAYAGYEVNIAPPATSIATQIYSLHLGILTVCAVIFVVVFSAMFYSVFKFRKSKGAKPDVNFHESTLIEIIWTTIPFIILIAMAVPATKTILDMKDTSNPDLTIKVTAYQWGWNYEYSQDGFNFYSNLSTPWSQIGQPGETRTEQPKGDYLLEVDNAMVVPVGKRIKLLVTSNDVIHGWYVPQLGINQYGIPGFIKDAWFKADRVGTFKGQCSQICGKLHGYMPITVDVKSESEYAAWIKSSKVKWSKDGAEAAAAPVVATAAFPAKFLFESGKVALPTDADKLIAAAVDHLKANADAKVDISGFTDKTGNAVKNAELAKDRAKAIREALKAGGIAEDRINMKKPETITGSSNDEDARRVELTLAAAVTPAPSK
jgi:cytochrome c oxidase subunit II